MSRWFALLGLALLSVTAHADTKSYYYTDAQRTVLAKADAQGNIVATYDYAPYGTQVLGSPPSGPTGYTGHVNDAESGLIYMQARYYDPVVGRFLSMDPVGTSAADLFNFNRYAYANNNPVLNIDRNGEAAYQIYTTVKIPIFYTGAGVSKSFVDNQVKLASRLIAEDGRTRFQIIPLSRPLEGANVMDVSPGGDGRAPVGGEGILSGSGGSAAHIDSRRSDVAGATLHDSLHFVPALGDGRKSDGYKQDMVDGKRIYLSTTPLTEMVRRRNCRN